MNIALEKTSEYVNGAKKRTYGDAFVRGNNGMCCLYPATKLTDSHVYKRRLMDTLVKYLL